MANDICRWGILSTAGIARKNWRAILNSGNGAVTAVGSRSVEKAQQFIDECQTECPFPTPPQAIGSYDELINSDQIDAVYVPLPTAIRAEWVVKVARAGKHVICEKPCGVNAAEVEEMVSACRESNVQFMDGVMYMHSARMEKVKAALADIGRLRRISCGFSFCAPQDFVEGNIRTSSNLEPQGCLGDLGWYTIRMSLWAMNYTLPEKVSGRLLSSHHRDDSPNPVPMEFSAELFFPDGVSATFYNSFLNNHQQWVVLSGTDGFIRIPDFVLPFFGSEVNFEVNKADFVVDGCDFHMEERTQKVSTLEYSDANPNAQETNLFRNFGDLALSGKPDPFWGEIAVKTQRVMDACLESAHNDGQFVTL